MPPLPPGKCPDYSALFQLNVRTRELRWDACVLDQNGSRVVSESELAQLQQALSALEEVERGKVCETDPTRVVLSTSTNGGTSEFRNDVCDSKPPVVSNPTLATVVRLFLEMVE
jgi:hypothetical protein